MSQPDRFEPTLDDDRLRAIGRLTANWAFAEMMFDYHLYAITSPDVGGADINFDGRFRISFKKRLDAFRKALNHPKTDGQVRVDGLALADDAKTLKRFRDDISHGIWGTVDPDNVKQLTFGRTQGDWQSGSTKADTATIMECADAIGELSHRLIHFSVVPPAPELPPPPRPIGPPASPFGALQNPSTPKGSSGLLGPPPEKDS